MNLEVSTRFQNKDTTLVAAFFRRAVMRPERELRRDPALDAAYRSIRGISEQDIRIRILTYCRIVAEGWPDGRWNSKR